MKHLFSPWRSQYIESFKSPKKRPPGGQSIFTAALRAGDDDGQLIVWRSRLCFVIMNRYPYNSGHLMVVPNRQTADILRRFGTIEETDYAAIQTISHSGHILEPLVIAWYEKTAMRGKPDPSAPAEPAPPPPPPPDAVPPIDAETLDQVLLLTMKPFLERCSEVVQQRSDFSTWKLSYCPLCGGEPEFAVITPAADRLLICSRCTARS